MINPKIFTRPYTGGKHYVLLFCCFLLSSFIQLKGQTTKYTPPNTPSNKSFSIGAAQDYYPLHTAFKVYQNEKEIDRIVDLINLDGKDQITWHNVEANKINPNQFYWAKIVLENEKIDSLSFENWQLVFPDFSSTIDYYLVNERDSFLIEKRGQVVAQVNKKWIHKGYAHSIFFDLALGDTRTLYLRGSMLEAKSTPLFHSILLPEQLGLPSENAWFNLIYMGAMLILCAYNLLFFFIARDKSYIFYGLFLLSNACYTFYVWMRLDTILAINMLSDNPYLLNYFALMIFPGIVSYTLFLQYFVNTKTVLPNWHRILNVLMYLSIPLIGICLYIISSPVIENKLATLIMALYILSSSILGLLMVVPFFRTGDKKAYFFFIGLLLLSIGVFFSAYSFVQYGRTGMFLFYFQTGSIVEVVCFSLGLGYKQLMNEREKQQTKVALLKTKMLQRQEHLETLRLQELNEMRTNLYTNITHEFRTPLTVILGMTQHLKLKNWVKEIKPKERNHLLHDFNLIERNSQNLLELINQLLDLSKLDANQIQLNYETKEIVAYIRYLGASFESLAENKGVGLLIESKIDELFIEADTEKLHQILFNLLSNAIKFTSKGGNVVLMIVQKNDQLQLEISDNGVGIAKESLPYIFDRFYQVENSSNNYGKGTGIGLALVKELVELMNGEIMVESALGKGTSFIVNLPIQMATQEPASGILSPNVKLPVDKMEWRINSKMETPLSEAKRNVLKINEDISKPELLIVEDNTDVVIYIQAVLAPHYNIQIARDGQEGIEMALAQIPDIIISDVMMPKKNGFELVELLKKEERTSHIPIIMLTAKATQEDKLAGLKYGADAYLMKPFDQEELLVRLEKLLEVRRTLQIHYNKLLQTNQKSVAPKIIENREALFLDKLQRIVEVHYTKSDFTVQEFAASIDLTYAQLNRKLKALTNKTPTSYLRRFRLQKAKELLVEKNELNISEIAYQVGFESPSYFSRTFMQAFGKSPNEIRMRQ